MNYELIMLNGAKRMKQAGNDYLALAQKKALASFYDSATTSEQILKVAEQVQHADSCFAFHNFTLAALKSMRKGYRALMYKIYVKGEDKKLIAKKYGISLSKLYRALAKAKTEFCFELKKLGCDSVWFWNTYGEYDWIQRLGLYVSGHSGRLPC